MLHAQLFINPECFAKYSVANTSSRSLSMLYYYRYKIYHNLNETLMCGARCTRQIIILLLLEGEIEVGLVLGDSFRLISLLLEMPGL